MDQRKWILLKLLRGSSMTNIRFDELRASLEYLGFKERIRGGHHLFGKPEIDLLINLRRDGGMAKPYQVRQLRKIVLENDLANGNSDA